MPFLLVFPKALVAGRREVPVPRSSLGRRKPSPFPANVAVRGIIGIYRSNVRAALFSVAVLRTTLWWCLLVASAPTRGVRRRTIGGLQNTGPVTFFIILGNLRADGYAAHYSHTRIV